MNYPDDIRDYDWHPNSPFYEEFEESEEEEDVDEEDVDEEDEWLLREELAELKNADRDNY
jgi:hypothetical protein